MTLKVASVGHLLAMKVLARNDRTRPRDAQDLAGLLRVANRADLAVALAALKLIQARGFNRRRDLISGWKRALRDFREARRRRDG